MMKRREFLNRSQCTLLAAGATLATASFTAAARPRLALDIGLGPQSFLDDSIIETKFNRFGLMNIRRGGKYVTVYLDDLSYTARHPADFRPAQHKQTIVTVLYPENGRKF